MGRYGFTGGGATDAIQKFLIERELQARQQQAIAMREQETRAQQEQQAAELRLRQQQEARAAEAQQASQAELANQREFGRATTIADRAMPGESVDADTRALLERQGFGGQINKVPAVIAPLLGSSPSSDAMLQPESFQMRGGSQYLSARTAADERAAEAERNRAAQEERANADRDMRREIAGVASGAREETAGLRNDLLRRQIADKDQADKTAADAKLKSENDARTVTQNALALAGRLKTHPGLNAAQGAYEMRGFTQNAQDFNAIRDQLVNSLALPNLGALKGPMSDKDILFIKNISTRLGNKNISEAEALKAIGEAETFLQGKLNETGGTAGATDGDGWTTLPNGVRIREKR